MNIKDRLRIRWSKKNLKRFLIVVTIISSIVSFYGGRYTAYRDIVPTVNTCDTLNSWDGFCIELTLQNEDGSCQTDTNLIGPPQAEEFK